MRILLNKKELIEGLTVGGSYAGRAKALPILDCVKIKVKSDCMNIISSDNENAISKRINFVESDCQCEFCVSLKSINQYVKLVSGDTVELIISDDKKMLEIKHKKGGLTLPLMNADEFPVVKSSEECTEISIDSATLHNWIVDARDFVANDELKPQMECILIYKRGNELGCAASDGHKLFCDYVVSENGEDFEYLLNKNAFSSVCSACKSCDNVVLKIGSANTTIVGDGITIVTRNICSKYPNFKMILPKDNNIEVKVDKNELKESISRCMVGANQATALLKFELDGMSLNLSAEDIDFSVKSVENLMVSGNGSITIGFKAPYMLNILNTITTDDVIIRMKDHTRAALFVENNENSNKLSLLMPMLLND